MAQPGLQSCLSSGSYTGWVKGNWMGHELVYSLLMNQVRENVAFSCFILLEILWSSPLTLVGRPGATAGPGRQYSVKAAASHGSPTSPSELLWFDFVFSGMVHKSHWTRWDEKGTPKFFIKCCFPTHTDLVLAGKGTVLSQSFFAFLSQF